MAYRDLGVAESRRPDRHRDVADGWHLCRSQCFLALELVGAKGFQRRTLWASFAKTVHDLSSSALLVSLAT